MDPAMLYFHLLIIVVALVRAEIEMDFSKFPESVTAPVGDEVTFECAVRVPGETLAWRWRPVDAGDDQWTSIEGTSDKDKLTSSLKVEVMPDTVNSLYQCVVWYGSISLASVPARLTIATIDLSRNTQEQRVLIAPLHNTVVMHCREPLSEPPAVISWWKETSPGKKKNLETPHGVLVIHNASTEDEGTYGCTARNELSGQTLELPERTYLRVQQDSVGTAKFFEDEEYVGTIDNDGALTVSVHPNNALRIWCGAVGTPPPKIMWTKQGDTRWRERHENLLLVDPFTTADEGVYTCTIASVRGQPSRRSWKVISLQPPYWEGSAASVNVSEGKTAHVACGTPMGQPTPNVHWLLNAEPLNSGKGIRTVGSDVYIDHVEKRHAGIVQCFACSPLGCVYDAALLSVVPTQITEREYSLEQPQLNPSQISKKHNRKNKQKKHKEMIPPSRPNVTRMSDRSVMLSWTHANHGMTILYFKVQYREDKNTSAGQWNTAKDDIKPFIHCYEIDGLIPDRYYKFRIAAIYSNNDNKPGRSTPKFLLQRYVARAPKAPVLLQALPISNHSVQLNWTWSNSNGGPTPEGFYVYWRAVSSAGMYAVETVPAHVRSAVLTHLEQDTQYEFKVQAYTSQAPSDFSRDIRKAKTFRTPSATFGTTTEAPSNDVKESDRPDALVTVGGAAGAAALLIILAATLLLCRRAKRLHSNKEKGPVPEGGATNGYISAKVPMTITANPMHAESGDGGVEMSFLHNNNCGNAGNNDDTLPHSRKNGPTPRQYV